MESARQGDYSRASKKQAQVGTASSAVDDVAAAIADTDRPNPLLDANGKKHHRLRWQLWCYRKADPPPSTKRPSHPSSTITASTRPPPRSNGQRPIFCRALRSTRCDPATILGPKERPAAPKQCASEDIHFYKGKATHPTLPPPTPTSVILSPFGSSSKRTTQKGERVAMHKTKDGQLNPVVHWIYTVRWAMAIQRTGTDLDGRYVQRG